MHESAHAGRISNVFDGIARLILIGLVAILPVFFIPATFTTLAQSKMSFLVVAIMAAAVMWIVARAAEGVVSIPRSALLYVTALLPVAYLASTVGSQWVSSSIVGYGVEQDTLAAMIVWYTLLALSALIFSHNTASLRLAMQALIGSISLVTIFQILHILMPSVFTFAGISPEATSNLVGSWHDLGIISGLGLFLAVSLWQDTAYGVGTKVALGVLGVASFVMLALIHFSDTFWTLAAISLVTALFVIYGFVRLGVLAALQKALPWLVLTVVAVVFAIFGTQISERFPEPLRITQVEVRPSWQGTLDVAKQSLDAPSAILFGSGPNSFIRSWSQYKPEGVNQTPFWDTDFNFGVGIIPTSIFTSGLFGFLAWAALALALISLAVGILRVSAIRARESQEPLQLSAVLLFGALYLIVFHVMYTPGQALTGLAFVLLGMLVAVSTMESRPRVLRLGVANIPQLLLLLGLIVAIGIVLLASGMIGRELLSNIHLNRAAVVYAQTQNSGAAGDAIARALAISPNNDRAHRAAAELGLVKLAELANDPNAADEATVALLQQTLQTTISHGLAAVTIDDSNYQNWLALATIYSNLAGANVEGSLDQAMEAYRSASIANPTNPSPKVRLAQLAIAKNDAPAAKTYLDEAIALKPDIAIAHYLKSQILAAEGNSEGAIQSAASAVQITQEDPVAWFNLGYILYASGNFQDAGASLERAVALRPEYANAIFILGIVYDQLDMKENAIAAFTRVGELNPSETWIPAVIANIQADRELFAGLQESAPQSQQPVESAPQN